MKKRLAFSVMAVVLLTFSAAVYAQTKPVTIVHWYWADNPKYSAEMQKIAADFNATNGKGITVVAQEYPWDGGAYSETLFRAVMGGRTRYFFVQAHIDSSFHRKRLACQFG